jgi:protein-disulfide isomerase
VLEKNKKTVKIVFKQFPLIRIHKFALQAALASLAAQKQGKFWEMHDQLYANFNQLSNEKIDEIARNIGLDYAKFKQDMNDPQIRQLVNRDMQEAQMNGVRGTPTIFVNGRLLKNRSLEGFQEAIDRALAELKKKK